MSLKNSGKSSKKSGAKSTSLLGIDDGSGRNKGAMVNIDITLKNRIISYKI